MINEDRFRVSFVIPIILIIIAFSMMILIAIDLATTKTIYVNHEAVCYDNHNKPINGVSCTNEVKCGIIGRTILKKDCSVPK